MQKSKPAIEPRAYCVRDAAKYLGLSPATVFRKIKDGSLAAKRLGRRTLIRVDELDRFLAPTSDPHLRRSNS